MTTKLAFRMHDKAIAKRTHDKLIHLQLNMLTRFGTKAGADEQNNYYT